MQVEIKVQVHNILHYKHNYGKIDVNFRMWVRIKFISQRKLRNQFGLEYKNDKNIQWEKISFVKSEKSYEKKS